jgi:predicted nucleic acid-binding protein
MTVTRVRYLADTSVITRLVHPEVAQVLGPLLDAGQVGTCGTLDLSLYTMVRNPADLAAIMACRSAAFAWLSTEDGDLRRAVQVQAMVAETRQRLTGWPALVVAAVAERHHVTVLHYDPDFDLIGKVTGQDTTWVVPEGSLPGQG